MRQGKFPSGFSARSGSGHLAQHGFNLIEVMIAIAVIGIFMGIGIPAIGDWVQNRQVNALAESIASGMRLAQAEAVQRNRQVDMVFATSDVTNPADPTAATLTTGGLTKSDPSPNWMVRVSGDATSAGFIHGKMASDGTGNARFSGWTGMIGSAGVTFSPFGKVSASIAANGSTTVPAGSLVFKVVNPSVQSSLANQRCIYVSTGGAVKVCDPRVTTSGDSRACVPACSIP